MINKYIHFLVSVVLIIVFGLFIYKQFRSPRIATASVGCEVDIDSINSNSGMSKEMVQAIVKDYLINNPDIIVESLENMQKKKLANFSKKASEYLEDNLNEIQTNDNPPILGNKDGDVTIVIFYDYNCGYCKRANATIIELLKQNKNVKIVIRPLPLLGETSTYLAKLALVVNNISSEKFKDIHDALMKKQKLSKDSMVKILQDNEIDPSIVENEINTQEINNIISSNINFAKYLGIRGVPSYIVEDEFIPGGIDLDRMLKKIKQARDKK